MRAAHHPAPRGGRAATGTHAAALRERPGRLAAAGLAVTALAAALLLIAAASAEAAVWVIPASARAFPDTKPGARQTIAVNAAGNEYEGVQVAIRGGGDHTVTLSWADGSDPLIVGNAALHRVYYVKVTRPTSHLGAKAGYYPDPLVPRDFGQALKVPGKTVSFYILTHVPYGTLAGTYEATLTVQNGAETVDLPFRLRVWGFGWRQLSTSSGFSVSADAVKRSIEGSGVKFTGENKRRIMTAFYTMMRHHGVSPTVAQAWPKVSSAGHIDQARYAAELAPYLGADGVGLQDNQVPWLRWFPWSLSSYSPSATKLQTYLTEVFRVYKDNGWHKKAYTYIVDETTKYSEERHAERLARVVHRASAKSGFRARFLLTDDPRPFSLGGTKTANTFLYDDVDIWAVRYYYFFGRVPALRERKRAGKEVWWYVYANAAVAKIPSYVVEKPPTDVRAMGWLMEQWNVDGLLNWGFNRWGKPSTGSGWRDPYQNPLSFVRGNLRSNGCTSLVYPGYYPRYGLNDPFAPPVSTLRFEALRDGLEEREYVKRARAAGTDGGAFVKKVMGTITWFPYPIRQANVFTFPKYTKRVSTFERARLQLAQRIEQYQ
jgi:hypothetical protein